MKMAITNAIVDRDIFGSINQNENFKVQLQIILDRVDEYIDNYDPGTELIIASNTEQIVIYPLRLCANVKLLDKQFEENDTYFLFTTQLSPDNKEIIINKADAIKLLQEPPALSSKMTLNQLDRAVNNVIKLGAWSIGRFDTSLVQHLDVSSDHWAHWITQLDSAPEAIVNEEMLEFLRMAINLRAHIETQQHQVLEAKN